MRFPPWQYSRTQTIKLVKDQGRSSPDHAGEVAKGCCGLGTGGNAGGGRRRRDDEMGLMGGFLEGGLSIMGPPCLRSTQESCWPPTPLLVRALTA